MKLSLFFALVFSAAAMRFSPILFHYLCSNDYMSPSVDLCSLLCSPSKHGFRKELVQIVTEAQEHTRLIIPSHDSETCFFSKYNNNSMERDCYRNVLEKANVLYFHQVWFQRVYNDVESNIDSYFWRLFWTIKDLNFLSTIKPYNNKALALVLDCLGEKVLKLKEEYQRLYSIGPQYSKLIMDAYKAHAPPVLLPSLDVSWAEANNGSVEAKVHYSLLSELLRRKIINSKFITSCRNAYSSSYKTYIKNKGNGDVYFHLDGYLVPPALLKNLELYYSILKAWLAFWFLGMKIKRTMPSPSQTALGPCLIESFNIEIKVMAEIAKVAIEARKHALDCSCMHLDYLLGCMRFSLLFNLLNHQDHAVCIDLMSTHRAMALEMIGSLAKRAK